MTLSATTCLGENTVPILRDIVAGLRAAGVDIDFDEAVDPGEREEALRAGQVDLVWACGLLTVEQIDDGLAMEVAAAPVFAGEIAPVYRSVVVVRADAGVESVADTFGGRLALNEYGSWSGYQGFERWLDTIGLDVDDYLTHVLTGSHRNSALALLDRVADVASIDETVWNHLVATGPAVDALRVIATTTSWPAPPFSVRSDLAERLSSLIVGLRPAGLERIEPATISDYVHMR